MRIISTVEAAKRLGVTPDSVRKMIEGKPEGYEIRKRVDDRSEGSGSREGSKGGPSAQVTEKQRNRPKDEKAH